MNLIRLLARVGPKPIRRLGLWALTSALASAGALAVVNAAARDMAEKRSDAIDPWLCLVFVILILFYTSAETRMVASLSADVERAIDTVRSRMLDRLTRADLRRLEDWDRGELFDSVTRNCRVVSMNSQFLALSVRAAILIVAILVYIAAVSMIAFLCVGALLAIGAAVDIRLRRVFEKRMREARIPETEMREHVDDLFAGFKEQRLNRARARELGADFTRASSATTEARCAVHEQGWRQYVLGETAFNAMLGAIAFAVPALARAFADSVSRVVSAVLFMATPVFGLMQTLMIMAEAERAAGAILDLEVRLETLVEPGSEIEDDAVRQPVAPDFREIRFDRVTFAFPAPEGERPFRVGPIDLSLRRGEIVFITGGNGSGKSTLIKLLTGLYRPDAGTIAVDGKVVDWGREDELRERMATVFSDFHLFPHLYGVDPTVAAGPDAEELLRRMEMTGTAHIIDGDRFSRRELSSGQRKRLGMVAALLEKKPILVLDEWAADQDPHFRRVFYRSFLPELRARGVTVIAVTHDDHYFDAADRRLRMENGRLIETTDPVASAGGSACF